LALILNLSSDIKFQLRCEQSSIIIFPFNKTVP
jgi:hypothetical protein